MVLDTPTGRLHGTLLLPEAHPPHPVALIVAGSGPTDRDGNSPLLPGRNDALEQLAEALAARGVASLRYDKRGIGESAAAGSDEASLSFDLFVDDAVGWLERLATDARFGATLVLGHSEGSLIGMLAAARTRAAAFVSLEGAGRPAADVLRSQLAQQLPPELLEETEQVLARLEAGHTVAELPAGIAAVPSIGQALFRASVQPYLLSWFAHDPCDAIAVLDAPSLVVQGSHDLQVPVADGEALARAARHGRYLLVEGMNHVLKLAPEAREENLAAYSDPDLPLAPALRQALDAFLDDAGLAR